MNKHLIKGNLGADPELRYTPSGTAVATFRVATTEVRKTNDEKKDYTEWHNIVVWDKKAEVCAEHLGKGDSVFIAGRSQTRSYEKDGVKHFIVEIHAQDMDFLKVKKWEQGEQEGIEKCPSI